MVYLFTEHRIYYNHILICHYFISNNDIFCVDMRINKETTNTDYLYYTYDKKIHEFRSIEKFDYDDIPENSMIYHKKDEDEIKTYDEICEHYKEKLIFDNI